MTVYIAEEEETFKQIAERYCDDPEGVICTKALRIFYESKDDAIKLRALELLSKIAP